MQWGFYCRTCGLSSPRFYQDAAGPRQDLAALQADVDALGRSSADGDDARHPEQLRIMAWVASHLRHDLWAECDTGVLRLAEGRPPDNCTGVLPSFVRA